MPIKYVPFIPEPVEGQAVLGNFNRILRYKGADDVSMTLQRGMPLYETVAFPTILFVKNEIDEIPYKITSKNNPDVVEGCIKVKS